MSRGVRGFVFEILSRTPACCDSPHAHKHNDNLA
jgi:hypothetical protein